MRKKDNDTLKNISSKNRIKLHEIAKKNTVRNSDGLTVLPKDDVWREDDKSNKIKQKVPHLKVCDGKVEIDENNSLQKEWFKKFKNDDIEN